MSHADSDVVPDAVPDSGPGAESRTDGASAETAVWEVVDELVRWLDRENALPPEQVRLLRILKLSEEAGEVAQAVIGATGQNPRKGHSHTWDDVQSELCDVIVTAMVALRTLTPDARRVFDGHLDRVAERAASSTGRSAPATSPTGRPAPAEDPSASR
ncbi:MazG-like family protein [Streptomyces sp. NPDC101150]|uniref:MazG-like family protein n=1 Tax=Streptomyces sp. NPDC101150 TaxID=3366114 RepID=UPI00381FF349